MWYIDGVYLIALQALQELMLDSTRFGFVVMDGNGTLFGAVSGNARCVT